MVALAPVPAHVVHERYADRVVGPGYDSLQPEERRALADANPDSFFNVVRSEADYPGGSAPTDLLAGNREALRRLLRTGRYLPHPPRLFAYRIVTATHAQTALVGDLLVEDYRSGVIKAHERTRSAKESELARHLTVLGVQSSPVGLAYRQDRTVADLLAEATSAPTELSFDTVDGTSQQVWAIVEPLGRQLVEAVGELDHAYIIDGHHRVAAADRVHPRGRFLAALVADVDLRLLPYHRVVAGPILPIPELLDRLRTRFDVSPLRDAALPEDQRTLVLFADGRWFELLVGPPDTGLLPAVLCDDVALLVGFDLADPRRDARLSYHPGDRAPRDIAAHAARSDGAALLLPPPTIAQVFAEADAGRVLPPKSTWFEPKLRSGVFLVER